MLFLSGCPSPVSQTPKPSGSCAIQPNASLIDPVAPNLPVQLGQSMTQYGKVAIDKGATYQIDAKAGQNLSFRVSPPSKLCTWVLTSNYSPLKGQEIPQDGQYFLHIEALKETTDFNATISLDSDTEIASTPQKQESSQTYREIPQNPAVTPIIPSQSIPPKQSVTYYGSKGEYTVNYQAGTYYGCVYGTGCLSLEKEKNIGRSSWRNGNYLYLIEDNSIKVFENNKLIFRDYFNSQR
jgi:hypothetical protein